MNNLPGVWNDPYCVAADDDVDNVDVDPGEGHLALSQSSLKSCNCYNFFVNINLGSVSPPTCEQLYSSKK